MYYYYDYDDYNNEDISIEGNDYIDLIETCFRFSSYFSFSFSSKIIEKGVVAQLVPFKQENVTHSSALEFRCYYECTDESKRLLLTHVNSLFDWIQHDGHDNPEDLTFYREDGSVFFWSETHEGCCAIYNDTDEDVSSVVKNRGWYYQDKNDKRVNYYAPIEYNR